MNLPETPKAETCRGKEHIKLLDHGRNIAKDRCIDQTRPEDQHIADVSECVASNMCTISRVAHK